MSCVRLHFDKPNKSLVVNTFSEQKGGQTCIASYTLRNIMLLSP